MHRYIETLAALNEAMALMKEEGDSLLVAAISHPLHMAESQVMLRRAESLNRRLDQVDLGQKVSRS